MSGAPYLVCFVHVAETNIHYAQNAAFRFMILTSRFLLHPVPRFVIMRVQTSPGRPGRHLSATYFEEVSIMKKFLAVLILSLIQI